MTKPIQLPPQKMLLEMFDYVDGDLFWKPSKAGTIDGGGYIQTGIKGKYFKNHRLIFMMHHGYVPEFIDHIDGNRLNNRIENLRPATRSENQYNKKVKRETVSGVKGVTWRSDSNKWRAKITVDTKEIVIGNYKTKEEAKDAIEKARALLHKQFANNG
jgi:hypothetical protein